MVGALLRYIAQWYIVTLKTLCFVVVVCRKRLAIAGGRLLQDYFHNDFVTVLYSLVGRCVEKFILYFGSGVMPRAGRGAIRFVWCWCEDVGCRCP